MITDSKVLEVHDNIIRCLGRQNVEVYFAVVGEQHQCCLSFDNRVLFETDNYEALHYVFTQWCDDESESAVASRMTPF